MFGIDLIDDHDAHTSEQERGFVDCHQVLVHCESEAETEEVARVLSEQIGIGGFPD